MKLTRYLKVVVPCLVLSLTSCTTKTVKREAGQVEIFHIANKKNKNDHTEFTLVRPLSPGTHGLAGPRTNIVPQIGNRVRFESDVVTIQVHSAYIDSLPFTLTGSKDVVLFADVWENAAAGYDAPPLTSIVYLGRNQMIPGHLNFADNLAYGPTTFKGSPLKIRFTLMILQKDVGRDQSAVADVIGKYSTAIPGYGVFVSQAAAVMRDILRAQPDVIAFDFEKTFISDEPEKLSKPILDVQAKGIKAVTLSSPEDNPLHRNYGWFQYGMYALVETAKRNQSASMTNTFSGKGSMDRPVKLDSSRQGYASTNTYVFDGGWLLKSNNGSRPATEQDRVFSKYIAFSVVPGQLAQNAEVLKAASQANGALLRDLQQTEENVKAAAESISKAADSLTYAVIKSRAESISDKIAKSKGSYSRFAPEFDRQWASLVAGFPEDWKNRSEVTALKEELTTRYKQIFESLSPAGESIATSLGDAVKQKDSALIDIQQAEELFKQSESSLEQGSKAIAASTASREAVANELTKLETGLEKLKALQEKMVSLQKQWGAEADENKKKQLHKELTDTRDLATNTVVGMSINRDSIERFLTESKTNGIYSLVVGNDALSLSVRGLAKTDSALSSVEDARKTAEAVKQEAAKEISSAANPTAAVNASKKATDASQVLTLVGQALASARTVAEIGKKNNERAGELLRFAQDAAYGHAQAEISTNPVVNISEAAAKILEAIEKALPQP